jgi:hypothetical protein
MSFVQIRSIHPSKLKIAAVDITDRLAKLSIRGVIIGSYATYLAFGPLFRPDTPLILSDLDILVTGMELDKVYKILKRQLGFTVTKNSQETLKLEVDHADYSEIVIDLHFGEKILKGDDLANRDIRGKLECHYERLPGPLRMFGKSKI